MKNKFLFSFAVLLFPILAYTIMPVQDLGVETELPKGATFNSTTGEFYWKPTREQIGIHYIKFKVFDGQGGYDYKIITINVTNS